MLLLLEIQDDEHPFRNAFLIWLCIVGALIALSRYVKRRDAVIDPEVAPRVNQVRARVQQQRSDNPSSASVPPAVPGIPREREDCPICIDTVKYPIETNCAHTFCAACFLQYHDQAGGVIPAMVRCPCCRRDVDLVAPSEPGWLPAEKQSAEGQRLEAKLAEYNARFSNEPRSWAAAAQDTPHLLSRLWRELTSGGADSMRLIRQIRFWGVVLTAAAYLLSPFDLVPEAVLGLLGYLDDAIVLAVVFFMVAGFFRSVMVQSAAQVR